MADAWIERHECIWARKAGLRHYYETQYFGRVLKALPQGRTIELGAGPGFFTRRHRCTVVTDVMPLAGLDAVVDAHHMPFPDATFDGVAGIDVLHHFRHPAAALAEVARVLRPRGRLVLVEPWGGPLASAVTRVLHSEDCVPVADPWGAAFPDSKVAMDGNAAIPKTLFHDHRADLPARCGLRVIEEEVFGLFGFFAMGGFTAVSLPIVGCRVMTAFDSLLPPILARLAAIKMFVVAEKA